MIHAQWRAERLYWCALIASLLPLTALNYFPSVDGPAHVLNASLLNRIVFQNDARLLLWYRWNPVVPPNWLDHLLLMPLVMLFSGPAAERIVIGLYVVTFVLGFRYMLRSISADTRGLEFLVFPLVFNSHIYWGFLNFCLSIGIFLILFGFVLRAEREWRMVHTVTLSVLALLLYLSHGLMFIFGLVSAIIIPVFRRSPGWSYRCIRIGVAFLPGLILFLYYSVFRVLRAQSITEWPNWHYAVSILLTLSPLAAFSGTERVLAGIFALLLYGMAGIRIWHLRRKWPMPELLGMAIAGAVSVFALPVTASGGTMITARLIYFPLIALTAWLAAATVPRRWSAVIISTSLMIAVGMQVARLPVYRAYDRKVRDLMTSLKDKIRPDGVYLEYTGGSLGPLTNGGQISSPDISPSAVDFLGVSSKAMILTNYEATVDHFPLIFRTEMNPYATFLPGGQLNPAALSQDIGGVHLDGILTLCSGVHGACDTALLDAPYHPEPLLQGPPQAVWLSRP